MRRGWVAAVLFGLAACGGDDVAPRSVGAGGGGGSHATGTSTSDGTDASSSPVGSSAADDPSASVTTASTATGGGAPAAGSGGDGASGGADPGSGGSGGEAPVEPDIDAIPWETGDDVGFGVARKDTQNPRGESAFIGYAGYGIGAEAARAWVTALYRAALRDRGVRWVYAVQGPAEPGYDSAEIGNSKIAASFGERLSDATDFVLVVGHSSGSFVAHELLRQLAGGLDPTNVTADRVVYFDLDGGLGGLTDPAVDRLRRGYFVGAFDATTGTSSPNRTDMTNGADIYPDAGGYVEIDASASGCAAGATWCVHMTPITTQPHDPFDGSEIDYVDFADRSVRTDYIDEKAADAGL